MIIGEVAINPRDVLSAWYDFVPGACAYRFTIRLQGDDIEGYSDREQWTTNKADVDKWLKAANKCIDEGNAWRDEMADSFDEDGGVQ